ncbi:cilia- and flagella-associated protein 251-like [Callorhinchus milii]|uniref:cilia- and flagella-associated protein 251-like n=1 Tax=Callorhinchus milii TaxID=7868 RepID=UPI001C3FB7BA|nr:cilia- and flagella-associated protein 251-like [Callorhinchus milii]
MDRISTDVATAGESGIMEPTSEREEEWSVDLSESKWLFEGPDEELRSATAVETQTGEEEEEEEEERVKENSLRNLEAAVLKVKDNPRGDEEEEPRPEDKRSLRELFFTFMFSDSSKEEEHEMAFLDLALAWAQRDLERLANQVKIISAKREEERSRQQDKETGGENKEVGSEEFPQIKAEIMMQRCKEFLLSSSSNQEKALSSPLDLELATAQEELELKTKEVKSIATEREGARRWWLKRREQMEENNTVVAEDVPQSDEEEQKEEEVQGSQREQTSVEAGVEELSRGAAAAAADLLLVLFFLEEKN